MTGYLRPLRTPTFHSTYLFMVFISFLQLNLNLAPNFQAVAQNFFDNWLVTPLWQVVLSRAQPFLIETLKL